MNNIKEAGSNKGLIKVPVKEDLKDSSYRKAAKFLFIIGAEQAGNVLKKLTQEQIDKIVAELLTIRSVGKEEAASLLEDFSNLYNKTKHSYGGINTAKDILQKAYGEDRAREILDSAVPEKLPKPFDYLENTETEILEELLKGELTATKVLVLSQLPPKKAAKFITSLSNEKEKKDIILQMAQTRKIDTRVMLDISEAMKKKFVSINTGKPDEINGKDILIKILKKLPPQTESGIINYLKNNEPELAEEIRNKIFTIDDITDISDKQLQKFLFKFDDKLLLKIIRSKNEKIRTKILNNLSAARAERLIEEEKNSSPIPKKDCEKAEAEFMNFLKNAEEKGEIIFARSEEDKIIF